MKYGNIITSAVVALATSSEACDSCFGPINRVEHVRSVVKRMQPEAYNATYGPTRALEWGQLNFMHTTDTHGWLEGHLKDANYGADWGDFVSFSSHMKAKARAMGVDMLLIDTGDLHDGAGLSDVTTVDGGVDGSASNIVFENVDYDLLTIGNHELYFADIAYQDFQNFSKFWGDKYLTSNVQIRNPETNEYEYLSNQYKYFTTEHGLRIMAFGVLFDFSNITNVTHVIPAATMVTDKWFTDAISIPDTIDLFLVLGHNTVLQQKTLGTFGYVHDAIRKLHPYTPIQFFGGHSHIRDFQVYDEASTALESGRYCETMGWFSMTGFNQTNSGYNGSTLNGSSSYPIPTRKATENIDSVWSYARRYLDWNRLTFEFHASGSQTTAFSLDTAAGLSTTAEITSYRKEFNLTKVYGCSPQNYCIFCTEFNSSDSLFPLITEALTTIVVNPNRTDKPRVSVLSTGSVRSDLTKGPFTYDDVFIVSPYTDKFQYIRDVQYSVAKGVLAYVNRPRPAHKRDFGSMEIFPEASALIDNCVDPFLAPKSEILTRDGYAGHARRQVETLGYNTTDAFGNDGDDTVHHAIVDDYVPPRCIQGTAGFPSDGSNPDVVDLIFIDHLASEILTFLGSNYTSKDVLYVIDENFTTQTYLPLFVEQSELFQQNSTDCPI